MSISTTDIKKLYGLSAGKCNICKINLFADSAHIGEMAHIIAKNIGGARGQKGLQNNNTYDNLILLCANDHTKVDAEENTFTETHLHTIKIEHEKFIESSLDHLSRDRQNDVKALQLLMNFIPFTMIPSYLNDLPQKISLDFLNIGEAYQNFHPYNLHLCPLKDTILKDYLYKFIQSCYELESKTFGSTTNVEYGKINNFEESNFYMYIAQEKIYKYTQDSYNNIIENIYNEVETAKNTVSESFYNLNNYLKDNYPEVNVNGTD